MSHKQKGQLTVSREWKKHLRKYWKKHYWHKERRAGKNKIAKDKQENR